MNDWQRGDDGSLAFVGVVEVDHDCLLYSVDEHGATSHPRDLMAALGTGRYRAELHFLPLDDDPTS